MSECGLGETSLRKDTFENDVPHLQERWRGYRREKVATILEVNEDEKVNYFSVIRTPAAEVIVGPAAELRFGPCRFAPVL